MLILAGGAFGLHLPTIPNGFLLGDLNRKMLNSRWILFSLYGSERNSSMCFDL